VALVVEELEWLELVEEVAVLAGKVFLEVTEEQTRLLTGTLEVEVARDQQEGLMVLIMETLEQVDLVFLLALQDHL
jgi:hypothetical protein